MRLTASFLKKDGAPVVALDRYPLSFEATLTVPTEGGKEREIYRTFVSDASRKGYYFIAEKFETPVAGTCRVKAEVKMLTMGKSFKEVLFTRTTEIAVSPWVYFRPSSPLPEEDKRSFSCPTVWELA